MDTIKLRYFAVLAKTSNVRRAADILRLSPSALSKVVRHLELELGVTLVTPQGRGITLTKEGRQLAQRIEPILLEIDTLKKDIQSEIDTKKENPLVLATFETFSTHFLDVLNPVEWAHRKLILHEVIPGELEYAVDQGKADFGITYLPFPNPNVDHIKVSRIIMGVFRRKKSFTGIHQQDLPFVVPVFPLFGTPTRVKGLDGWPDTAYQRKVQFEVTLMESAFELCRKGLCAGYFPSFVVCRHNKKVKSEYELERHPLEGATERCYNDVYVVKRKDRAEDKDLKLIAKLVRLGTRMES